MLRPSATALCVVCWFQPRRPPPSTRYVEVDTSGREVDSDEYACNNACGERVINSPASAGKVRLHSTAANVGADGKKPSGGWALGRAGRTGVGGWAGGSWAAGWVGLGGWPSVRFARGAEVV